MTEVRKPGGNSKVASVSFVFHSWFTLLT